MSGRRFTIRPAKRSSAKPLIGFTAKSGSGKTWSALMLARGFVGPEGTIVMIDTESGRGEMYADELRGGYDVLPMQGDFSPAATGEAIDEAERAGAKALIIDSASHEWEGMGGVLDMAERRKSGTPDIDGKKQKAMHGQLVWQKPKIDHYKHFIGKLLSTPIDLVIVCMRGKYPMEEGYDQNGKKTLTRSKEIQPKQDRDLLFEMMAHGWIDPDHRYRAQKPAPGLDDVLRDGERIDYATGERLRQWALERDKPAVSGEMSEGLERALMLVAGATTQSDLKSKATDLAQAVEGLSPEQATLARSAYSQRLKDLEGVSS